MNTVRCAIYTRKSSEEGLQQDFNSLDAQHAACSAYILSQASEGWTQLKDRYDDGGISGGTLERPGLKRLLTDIGAGRVDIVVVYKVDRLTRSLLDFAKLVETFDKADTSFVSVTQSFNTTNSMGRLTLNMLLSFAQFEREVTAERIRDKLAASKARGMWMGGTPPLGYRPDGRTLAIVENDANLVRAIFQRYLEIGNVRLLTASLDRDQIRVPVRITVAGKAYGGDPFNRGQLYKILNNPTYIGRIRHKEITYPGLQPAIIDQHVWDKTQAMLSDNAVESRAQTNAAVPSLLAGKMFDANGEPLVAAHACKGKVRYRYYVSRPIQHGGDAAAHEGVRIPAREIEMLVVERVAQALDDPMALLPFNLKAITAEALGALRTASDDLAAQFRSQRAATVRAVLQNLIMRIDVRADQVMVRMDPPALANLLGFSQAGDESPITLNLAVTLKRSGNVMRIVTDGGRAIGAQIDRTLINAIIRGRTWWGRLTTEPGLTIAAIAAQESITEPFVTRMVRLAFLDPTIVAAILDGTAPVNLTLDRAKTTGSVSPRWSDQRRALGFIL